MKPVNIQLIQSNQRGAALVVSLILLLVMTIVGVAAMDGARMEIKMAGMMQQDEVALRRAERTLLTAEADIESMVATAGKFEFGAVNDAYYLPEDTLAVHASSWKSVSSADGPVTTDDSEDNDDAYVVEYLGPMVIPGETLKEETDAAIVGALAYTYRTTTRSASDGKSVRIVQSVYTTLEAP